MGKASMSFLTALSLSFNNLRTKKARTILTSFAGSIGIIGIALILSLSNGVNDYIKSLEEETLSEYPLQIQNTTMDLTAVMANSAASGEDVYKRQPLANGYVKARTGDSTTDTVYTGWYTAVYLPEVTPDTSGTQQSGQQGTDDETGGETL